MDAVVVIVVMVVVVVGLSPYHLVKPFITSTSLDTLIMQLGNHDNYNWMGQFLSTPIVQMFAKMEMLTVSLQT